MRLVGVPGYDIVSLQTALELASSKGLDLVAMNNDSIPVCKIISIEKMEYAKKKQEKQAKKNNSHNNTMKEIRMNPFIATNDFKVKANQVSRILSEGNKVKIVINYKGRSTRDINGGIDKLNSLACMINYNYRVDKEATIDGTRVYMIVSPSK